MANEFENNYNEFLLSLKAKSLRQEREAEDNLLDSLETRDNALENAAFRVAKEN